MVAVVTANLVGGFVECTLFGLFFPLSLAAFVLLLRRHHAPPDKAASAFSLWAARVWDLVRSPFAVVTIVFTFSCTIHLGFTAQRLITAVVKYGGGEAATSFLIDNRERAQVARVAVLELDIFLGDVVVAYGAWIIWGRNPGVMIFAVLAITGVLVSVSGMAHELLVFDPSNGIFTEQAVPWITASTIMTLCANVYSTAVIAWRIWFTTRSTERTGVLGGGRSLLDCMAIPVESAALESANVILYLVWYLTGSRLETIGSGCGPVVIGITFMLIIVRVGLGRAHESRMDESTLRWATPVVLISAVGASTVPALQIKTFDLEEDRLVPAGEQGQNARGPQL
ncbi:hypothetical protein C8Q80DRAFT_1267613 [Daedaleopsis nitida]|nr:hypothetical protein C8Q80DRAFT_1267613 [Daedaleopsis nitida]